MDYDADVVGDKMDCINCKKTFSKTDMENQFFCKDCCADKMIKTNTIYGVSFYLFADGSELKIFVDDPSDRLGRVKFTICRQIINYFQRPIQGIVTCNCGGKIKLDQSILVHADGFPVAFCDMDCYEKWKGSYLCQELS